MTYLVGLAHALLLQPDGRAQQVGKALPACCSYGLGPLVVGHSDDRADGDVRLAVAGSAGRFRQRVICS